MAKQPEVTVDDVLEDVDTEALQKELRAKQEKLQAFGAALSKTLIEDISHRQASGVEARWIEDEEYYEGIDEVNRDEEHDLRSRRTWVKPEPAAARTNTSDTRSKIFPNITGPFVDAAASRLADVVVPPATEPSWGLKATPIADLIEIGNLKLPKDMSPEEKLVFLEEVQNIANVKAEAAKRRIHDWHTHCGRNAEVRSAIEDAAKIGTGIIYAPYPRVRKRTGYFAGKIMTHEMTDPATKRVDPWNFFPDKDCGEDIHSGTHCWLRDYLTPKALVDLMQDDNYIPESIMLCLAEGPLRTTMAMDNPFVSDDMSKLFEIWYYHGVAERSDLEAAGYEFEGDKQAYIPVMISMVNGKVIRVALNPLDTGDMPFGVFNWRKRRGTWAGIGVARQIRTPQRIVTGAARNMMENAGISAGPMIVFRQGMVRPANGTAELAPRKVWFVTEDADSVRSAADVIGVIKVDMMVNELMAIIDLGLKLAENTTGLPMLLQGQQGSAPDTVGGMKLLYNNTAAPLRRLARMFDDTITTPEIERYYRWLLQYGKDEEKGDFIVWASGSSTLVERDLQEQELGQMAGIVLDPRYGLDPKKWAREWLMSRRFDHTKFDFDDEQWQQVLEQMAQPPANPMVDVANIKAEVEKYRIDTGAQVKELQNQFLAWSKQIDVAEHGLDRELELILAMAVQETAGITTAAESQKVLDQAKGRMTEVLAKIKSQERLAGLNAGTRQLPFTEQPAEPPGKAAPGMSITQ